MWISFLCLDNHIWNFSSLVSSMVSLLKNSLCNCNKRNDSSCNLILILHLWNYQKNQIDISLKEKHVSPQHVIFPFGYLTSLVLIKLINHIWIFLEQKSFCDVLWYLIICIILNLPLGSFHKCILRFLSNNSSFVLSLFFSSSFEFLNFLLGIVLRISSSAS